MFSEKNRVFFITEEKTRFLKKDLQNLWVLDALGILNYIYICVCISHHQNYQHQTKNKKYFPKQCDCGVWSKHSHHTSRLQNDPSKHHILQPEIQTSNNPLRWP